MPGDKLSEEIYLRFKGDVTYAWACSIVMLYSCEGLYEFIRRTICYFLRERGYLRDEIYIKFFKNEDMAVKQNLEIDTIQ